MSQSPESLDRERKQDEGAQPAARGRRVLIIEDDVDTAEGLCAILELDEHTVEMAHSGPSGIAKARTFAPEVVLCDIGLPGMDGFAVAEAFRADETLRSTFLVALSGYTMPADLAKARAAGFDEHLAKPPNLTKLSELVLNRGGSKKST